MHILCPHCRNPIEVVTLTPHDEIACPSCGSSFRLETEPTTTAARAGAKVGRFEVLGTVGQGAFGTVFKARDPSPPTYRAGTIMEEMSRALPGTPRHHVGRMTS
jgi:hypothetical protein